jgi:hypothetical protein
MKEDLFSIMEIYSKMAIQRWLYNRKKRADPCLSFECTTQRNLPRSGSLLIQAPNMMEYP